MAAPSHFPRTATGTPLHLVRVPFVHSPCAQHQLFPRALHRAHPHPPWTTFGRSLVCRRCLWRSADLAPQCHTAAPGHPAQGRTALAVPAPLRARSWAWACCAAALPVPGGSARAAGPGGIPLLQDTKVVPRQHHGRGADCAGGLCAHRWAWACCSGTQRCSGATRTSRTQCTTPN